MSGLENVWSWDIEVFSNCFTLSAVEMNSDKVEQFVIHENVNQVREMKKFLLSCKGLIGYNSINFDYPIVHLQILTQDEQKLGLLNGEKLARKLYLFTQGMIQKEFPPKVKHLIPQRDTYRIWHFDNEAKSTSLKMVQVAIRWKNVEDTPFSHTTFVTKDLLPELLEYNLNDCLSNKEFYLKKTIPKVKMRRVLSQKYGLNLLNANDPKIGEEIILKQVAEKKGMDLWDLKKLRTSRQGVALRSVILPQVKFESWEFKRILSQFQGMLISDTRRGEGGELPVVFDGMRYEFGFGGIHAARAKQMFKDIDSADVSSYYPNLSIQNNFYPEHLGKEFGDVYVEIYYDRKKYPKGSPENEGLKLSLNGAFGKSNSEYSALYDPQMTMQITINGQLLLAMLCEKLTISGAARVVMANTDGIEVIVRNRKLYEEICKEWEVNNKLVLEHAQYKVLAVRDVNNYIAVKHDNKTKEKGAYEVDKEVHKDHSMRIVPFAIRREFQEGTPFRQTILEHEDIWDFMMAVRAKTGELRIMDNQGQVTDALRTMRYYISRSGKVLMKLTESKYEKVHQRAYMTEMNRFVEKKFADYNVDKRFYLGEADKLMLGVATNQISI